MSGIPLTEKDWQSWVIDAARLFGYRIAHFRPAQTARGWRTAMTGDPGWPDLVLLKPPRLILAELKVTSPVRPEQTIWLAQLAAVPGVEAYVWKPDQRDQVLDILRSSPELGNP